MPEDVALREDVATEPLIGGWYAWLHALSPITSALLSRAVHLPILQSYLAAPSVHANAVSDPSFRGGPFVDVVGDRSEEIAGLVSATEKSAALGMQAARELLDMEGLLLIEADGSSLQLFYERVPESLRGLIELSYDREHRPSVQIHESLLYRSSVYRRDEQSLDLFVTEEDRRPFVLSTPRLLDQSRCRIHLPFADPRWDQLFSTRLTPQPLGDLRGLFHDAIEPADDAFASLFAPVTVAGNPGPSFEGVRIRYLGHACVLVESASTSILIDPLLPSRPSGDGRFGWRDLPRRIDLCLITHGHPDHMVFEALLPLRHRIETIVVPRNVPGSLEDPSLKLALRQLGFQSILEVDALEALRISDGLITPVPFMGEHADLRIRSKSCYHVEVAGNRILFAADAAPANLELIDRISAEAGPVDIIFLGMECDGAPLTWLYGHLFARTVERSLSASRRLSGSDSRLASEWVRRTGASQAYVYAMGAEPWVQHIMATNLTADCTQKVEIRRFLETCRERGIAAEELSTARTLVLERKT
jgi:L-ascorbate metabolism protein UlaG (beta-lactamase superfamily)